eukprot:2148891-Amphidinium_carterae.1
MRHDACARCIAVCLLPPQALPIWHYIDLWQENARGIKAASLLCAGHIIEVTITSGGGRALGHMMFRVVAVHPGDGSGVALEVSCCGVSNKRLREWAKAACIVSESPIVHICAGKGTCAFSAVSRAVLHVHRWRLRNPLIVREPWFENPADIPPVSIDCGSAGHAGMEENHGTQEPVETGFHAEERALLHRFEQMRDGIGADPVAPLRA